MQINLFTVIFIFVALSITHSQTRKETLKPKKYLSANITVNSYDKSTLLTMDAAATEPFDLYIMNPAQFVEYSIFASKGAEFEYDKENSRIGVKYVDLNNVEIFENGSKVVIFNPGNTELTISYSIKTTGRPRELAGFEAMIHFFQDRWYWLFPLHIGILLKVLFIVLLIWTFVLRMLIYCIPFKKIMSFKQALGLERTDDEEMQFFFKNWNGNRGRIQLKRINKKPKERRSSKKKSEVKMEIFVEPPSAPVMNRSFFNTKPNV